MRIPGKREAGDGVGGVLRLGEPREILTDIKAKVEMLSLSWEGLDREEKIDDLQEVARDTIAAIAALRQENGD